ncbi:phosphoesterase [Frateuria sp. Soil773]|uniref:alkaline phosphatase family protein n=1 Tax=Frateuria sp. Soil773 TaxID=1736407 RepID=UPI0006FE7C54|nr:alkaline phosphatase family protein [Frateuria sp. Soil773]KRE89028.1 phosphoesterase [Frateuria sp. Soil773]
MKSRAFPLWRSTMALLSLALTSALSTPTSAQPGHAEAGTPVRHVFLIVLENEPFDVTFGAKSLAPYLAHTLPAQGALLSQYYATGHYSLDNYISLISGQAPNPDTQKDCGTYVEFRPTTGKLDANGQLAGQGCVFPAQVKTLADQLHAAGLSWKGYMEGMGSDPAREAAQCGHAAIGSRDHTNGESLKDRYADKHDPFVYFHSIIDDPAYCGAHVVPLDDMANDLRQVTTTPNFAFITPDLCHDGHDAPCRNGEPGGLVSADQFLRTWVPRITASPAFRKDGLLIVTFDEGIDAKACCGEQGLPGGPQPGQYGPGGGRIGAVMLSPFIRPGTVSDHPYNHYSTLRSIEQWFGLPHLGYAKADGVPVFGRDVFTQSRQSGTAK